MSSSRIFVGEYLCGGGVRDQTLDSIPSTLLAEGKAMWRSLTEDIAGWARVITPVDTRLQLDDGGVSGQDPIERVPMPTDGNTWQHWMEIARSCDDAIVIAPESEGILARGISMMRGSGIHVVAPSTEVLRLTSDKRLTARLLKNAGVASPATIDDKWMRRGRLPNGSRYIIKPSDGCGTADVRVVDDVEDALELAGPNDLVQEFWDGRPASMLIIASPETAEHASACFLPAVWQTISGLPNRREPNLQTFPQSLQYNGGQGPVDPESQRRIQMLAQRTLDCLPGRLSGFIGIDVVLGDDANHDAVIEINPRLTTSYVGIRRMVDENLTRRLFDGVDQRVTTTVSPGMIDWDAAGVVRSRRTTANV
ncbi:MAG: ATP-grasp domain-containing protein [Planctomycetota bacterium]